MSEEKNYEVKIENHQCFCQSKWFRKFLTVALGTFVGVFCALSLFAALHKPPMPCPMAYHMMKPPMYHHHLKHFNHFEKARCHKKMLKEARGLYASCFFLVFIFLQFAYWI